MTTCQMRSDRKSVQKLDRCLTPRAEFLHIFYNQICNFHIKVSIKVHFSHKTVKYLSSFFKENKDYFKKKSEIIPLLQVLLSILRVYKFLIEISVLELGICLNSLLIRNLREHWLQFSLFSKYWGGTVKYSKLGNSRSDQK